MLFTKNVWQIENGIEYNFVEHWLISINWPKMFF